jgi:hypothetical protein
VRTPRGGYGRAHGVSRSASSGLASDCRLSSENWRLLGAIALEQGLSRSVLAYLSGVEAPYGREAGPRAVADRLDGWLRESTAAGLLVSVGPTRALS